MVCFIVLVYLDTRQKQNNIENDEKVNLFFGSIILIGVFSLINNANISYIKNDVD